MSSSFKLLIIYKNSWRLPSLAVFVDAVSSEAPDAAIRLCTGITENTMIVPTHYSTLENFPAPTT